MDMIDTYTIPITKAVIESILLRTTLEKAMQSLVVCHIEQDCMELVEEGIEHENYADLYQAPGSSLPVDPWMNDVCPIRFKNLWEENIGPYE
jgi:hypothetical protein